LLEEAISGLVVTTIVCVRGILVCPAIVGTAMNKEMVSIKAAGDLLIYHLVDENRIHPECITRERPLQ